MSKKSNAKKIVAIETEVVAPVEAVTEVKVVKATLSSRIRELAAEGKSRSEIVKIVSTETGRPIRYQHVRNVLVTQLKKVPAKAE